MLRTEASVLTPGGSSRIPTTRSMNCQTGKRVSALRERIRIGAALANQLPVKMGANECAALLGISPQALRVQECLALYKVRMRLLELAERMEP